MEINGTDNVVSMNKFYRYNCVTVAIGTTIHTTKLPLEDVSETITSHWYSMYYNN